ncbi:MAG TPA: hypothetical protein VD978_35610 [Azospirillum sp.]|nr:hypothetical protein [Azospirillum sp.]
MHRFLAITIVGSVALTSAAWAQSTSGSVEQSFSTLLAEAKTKTPSISESATINTSLAAAEWYWDRDARSRALDYLNFARGKLGLSLLPRDVTVVERPNSIR